MLFLDEIHRFTKAQQDALLPGVENRQVILVAATTENPSFSVIAPLLSRSMLITLTSLTDEEVADVLDSAAADERGLAAEFVLADEARDHLVRMSGGDARRALTALEAAAVWRRTAYPGGGARTTGDDHPHRHRAGHRPRRGSIRPGGRPALRRCLGAHQVDARVRCRRRPAPTSRGCSRRGGPRFIARRIVIAASGDVGMGDPTAFADRRRGDACGGPDRDARGQDHPRPGRGPQRAGAQVERRLCGHQRGIADVRAGKVGAVPVHLGEVGMPVPSGSRRPRPRRPAGEAKPYVYAHDEPDGVAAQQYLPDDLQKAMAQEHSYYRPTDRGFEARLQERWAWLRARLGRG